VKRDKNRKIQKVIVFFLPDIDNTMQR